MGKIYISNKNYVIRNVLRKANRAAKIVRDRKRGK